MRISSVYTYLFKVCCEYILYIFVSEVFQDKSNLKVTGFLFLMVPGIDLNLFKSIKLI